MKVTTSIQLALLALLSAVAACSTLNPNRLDDQVALYHDDLRWGRLPAASQAVLPTLRERFERAHARWGNEVQIMDLEQVSSRSISGTNIIRTRYMWTLAATTDVRETVIETRWRPAPGGDWAVIEELVIAGDPTLLANSLAVPTPARSSGGEAATTPRTATPNNSQSNN